MYVSRVQKKHTSPLPNTSSANNTAAHANIATLPFTFSARTLNHPKSSSLHPASTGTMLPHTTNAAATASLQSMCINCWTTVSELSISRSTMNGHIAIANRAFIRSGAGPVTLSAWNAVIL